METKVKFRYLCCSDIPTFCYMLMNIWLLGRRAEMSRFGKSVAGLLYVLSILEESEKILVALNKEPIGFCGYGLGRKKKIYNWIKKAILFFLPRTDQRLYQKFYEVSRYGDITASIQNAEITILIISPQYYGKGLGKQLCEKVEKIVFVNGSQSIFALSDSSSRWQFYTKQGYKKVFEKKDPSLNLSAHKESLYIFQKVFDK